jgi:NAD(P)H-flavin reductase
MGYVQMPIKIYRDNEETKVKGGMMSQYLDTLELGDKITIEGPRGDLTYYGHGNFSICGKWVQKTEIGMMAGGSGLTPMFQLIHQVWRYNDSIKIKLLYANKSEKDIWLKSHLDELAKNSTGRFEVRYIVDKPENEETWRDYTGYINKEIIDVFMPRPGPDTLMLQWGPPGMIKHVRSLLTEMEYPDDNYFKF